MVMRTVLSALLVTALGCGESTPVDSFAGEKRAVLSSLAERVLLPGFDAFAADAASFAADLDAYAASPTEGGLAGARTQWGELLARWQLHAATNFGPGGDPILGALGTRGGQGIGADIYSWPDPGTNACRIDQETVAGTYQDEAVLADERASVRGLDAVEYLLFRDPSENGCPPEDPINGDGTFAALGEDGVLQARGEYAAAAASLVAERAAALRDAWTASGGNFLGEVQTAGDGSTVYDSAQRAVDSAVVSLFFAETVLLDVKLGDPTGLRMSTVQACAEPPCPELLEAPWSGTGRTYLLANLDALRLMFAGADGGLGLNDLMEDLGGVQAASDMLAAIDDARTALENIDEPLPDALSGDADDVDTAFRALQTVVVVLETDVASILDVDPPQPGGTDND